MRRSLEVAVLPGSREHNGAELTQGSAGFQYEPCGYMTRYVLRCSIGLAAW